MAAHYVMENWFVVSWRDGRAGGVGLLLCLARGESGLIDRWKRIERLPRIAEGWVRFVAGG